MVVGYRSALALSVAIFGFSGWRTAAAQEPEPPRLRAGELTAEVAIDGVLNEAA